jgi:hypothetical protein
MRWGLGRIPVQMHADDDRFEIYLKQFSPRAPEALPVVTRGRHARRALALGAWAVAIVLTAAVLATNWNVKVSHFSTGTALQTKAFHPLTIRTANQLLERAPSLKAAMNELVLDSEEKTVPKSQSAFAALSKENINP